MSDIRCVVCGEPWDAYGINHGDMLPWEVKLFRAGAGCPSCEGVQNGWTPKSLSDVENGDDDPMLQIIAAERVADGTKPEWKRPDDIIHWECDGCGVQVITNHDACVQDGSKVSEALEYNVPPGSNASRWYHSHNFRYADPETTPAHTFENGLKVCECCLEHCTECDAPLCSHLELESDSDGYAITSPADDSKYVCSDCLSNVEYDCTLENIESEGRRYLKDEEQVNREQLVLIADAEDYLAALKQVVMPFGELPKLKNRGVGFGQAVPEDWSSKVFSWFWDNNQEAISPHDNGGGYPSDNQLQECLLHLGWLSEEYREMEDDE